MTGGGGRRDIAIAKCAVVDSFLDARANQKETAFPNDEGDSPGKVEGTDSGSVASRLPTVLCCLLQEQCRDSLVHGTQCGERGPNREIKETGSDCSRYPPAEFSRYGTSRTCLIL